MASNNIKDAEEMRRKNNYENHIIKTRIECKGRNKLKEGSKGITDEMNCGRASKESKEEKFRKKENEVRKK